MIPRRIPGNRLSDALADLPRKVCRKRQRKPRHNIILIQPLDVNGIIIIIIIAIDQRSAAVEDSRRKKIDEKQTSEKTVDSRVYGKTAREHPARLLRFSIFSPFFPKYFTVEFFYAAVKKKKSRTRVRITIYRLALANAHFLAIPAERPISNERL